MIAQLFDSTTIPVLEQVVNFAQSRHHLLASNVANFDTPGYQIRDYSTEKFESRLREAVDRKRSGGPVPYTADPTRQYGDPLRDASRRLESILYHDGSNVSMEHQVAELSKNQGRHNLAVAIMESQFRLLEAAVSERA